MANYTSPHHIQIDIQHALHEMLMRLDCCRGISVLPEGTSSVIDLIMLLPDPPGHQVHRLGNNGTALLRMSHKVDMIVG